MTQPDPAADDFYQSSGWRTPAGIERQRWENLSVQFQLLGRAFDDLFTRVDRIETKLDELLARQSPRRQNRKKLAEEPPS